MGAYLHILNLYPDLVEKAQEYNYPASSVCILSGNELELQQKFPETYANLQSCKHNRDRRTPFEYGRDLVASWLFEDFLMESLSNAGLIVSGAGADKNREVLPATKVSSSSDCIVSYNGKTRLLELMSDYNGYWAKYGKMELRDAKFQKMKNSASLFLGISTIDNKYILLDMNKEFESTFIPSYSLYGHKPAYSIKLPKSSMKDLDFPQLADDIKNMM
ncbi:MAG TPA: hypothetical protein IAC03_06620 [Candidatus Coprenecus pullistercoris]|nr:hypothetical protein [Candidatus Coprenecus pullistercoris]